MLKTKRKHKCKLTGFKCYRVLVSKHSYESKRFSNMQNSFLRNIIRLMKSENSKITLKSLKIKVFEGRLFQILKALRVLTLEPG